MCVIAFLAGAPRGQDDGVPLRARERTHGSYPLTCLWGGHLISWAINLARPNKAFSNNFALNKKGEAKQTMTPPEILQAAFGRTCRNWPCDGASWLCPGRCRVCALLGPQTGRWKPRVDAVDQGLGRVSCLLMETILLLPPQQQAGRFLSLGLK